LLNGQACIGLVDRTTRSAEECVSELREADASVTQGPLMHPPSAAFAAQREAPNLPSFQQQPVEDSRKISRIVKAEAAETAERQASAGVVDAAPGQAGTTTGAMQVTTAPPQCDPRATVSYNTNYGSGDINSTSRVRHDGPKYPREHDPPATAAGLSTTRRCNFKADPCHL